MAVHILGLVLLAVAAAWLGWWFGRRAGKAWLWGWGLPLIPLGLVAVGLNFRQPEFVPPISWLLASDNEWLVLTFSVPMMLGTLAARAKPGQGRVLHILSAVVVLRSGVLPALTPLLTVPELQNMATSLDVDGVCLQSTSYNCGPAAAVTALKHLGIPAEEGGMGVLAKTNSMTGTDDWNLEQAMLKRHAADGLVVKRCYLKSAEELKNWPAAIALIKYGFLVDHYVAVLGFTEGKIIIGDPLIGKTIMPLADFEKVWRNVAILMRREER